MTSQYLEEKRKYDDNLLNVISSIRYDKYPIMLIGSGSLQSQKYYSDYDIDNFIKKEEVKTAYEKFKQILENIKNNTNLYFIELKMQTLDNQKYKIQPNQQLSLKEFTKYYKNIEYVKIDLVNFSDNTFMEVSINYIINNSNSEKTTEEYIKGLQESIKELIDDKMYYKALKRYYNIFRAENKEKEQVKLTKFFNSDIGVYYRLKSNLEAINLVKEYYDDNLVNKRIEENLKVINKYNLTLDKLNKYINDEGLKQLKKMKLI